MDREFMAVNAAKTAADLRSQLNQIAAASQVLEQNTESEKGRSYLAVINQGVCRMLRIVGRMELSHRLTGEDDIAPALKCMDLAPWLDGLSRRLQGVLADIGVSFALHCPDRLLAAVDGELLQQMLLELISNMALAGTDITLSLAQKTEKIYFTLNDNGPGKANGRPVLPAVLEEQEEQASLELARQIAEVHGGSLVVSTNTDLGLSIAVSIPLQEDTSCQMESPRASWHSGGFDPVLIAMSQLLPSRSFLPENLG